MRAKARAFAGTTMLGIVRRGRSVVKQKSPLALRGLRALSRGSSARVVPGPRLGVAFHGGAWGRVRAMGACHKKAPSVAGGGFCVLLCPVSAA